jgi:hypothetical protein
LFAKSAFVGLADIFFVLIMARTSSFRSFGLTPNVMSSPASVLTKIYTPLLNLKIKWRLELFWIEWSWKAFLLQVACLQKSTFVDPVE